MSVKTIAVACAHGANLPNITSPYCDVLSESHRLCERVVQEITAIGSTPLGPKYDDVSTTIKAAETLIANWCKSQQRDVDALIGFTVGGNKPGTDVWYLNQDALSREVVNCISFAGTFVNNGNSKKTNSDFLNGRTDKPGVLISVCCTNVQSDVQRYQLNFDYICAGIARSVCSLPEEWPPGG